MSRHQHRCGHVGRVPCHLELVATLGAWRLAFGASTMELVISALICTWVSIFVGMDGLGQFGELHIDYVSKHPSQCIGVSIFFSCHAWIYIYGCKVRCHTLVCTFRGSEPLILCNACVDSMVIRFEQVCISQQGLLFRSLLLCISIDTLSVSRGGAREE